MCKKEPEKPSEHTSEHVKSQNFLGHAPRPPHTIWTPLFVFTLGTPQSSQQPCVSVCVSGCLGEDVCLSLSVHAYFVCACNTYPFLARIWQRASCGPSQVHSTLVVVKSDTCTSPPNYGTTLSQTWGNTSCMPACKCLLSSVHGTTLATPISLGHRPSHNYLPYHPAI